MSIYMLLTCISTELSRGQHRWDDVREGVGREGEHPVDGGYPPQLVSGGVRRCGLLHWGRARQQVRHHHRKSQWVLECSLIEIKGCSLGRHAHTSVTCYVPAKAYIHIYALHWFSLWRYFRKTVVWGDTTCLVMCYIPAKAYTYMPCLGSYLHTHVCLF